MFSAFMTTHSLPPMSSTLPLRTELAITLTTVASLPRAGHSKPPAPRRREAGQIEVAAFYRLLSPSPSRKRTLAHARKPKPVVAPRQAPGPAPVPAGAKPHQGRHPHLVRDPGLRRGRHRGAAGVPWQRDAPLRLRHRADRPRRRPPPPLPAHLAGVRLQEALGGGRGANLHLRSSLPQPRARPFAPPGLHHARMVPG